MVTAKEHNQSMECVRQEISRRYKIDKIKTAKLHNLTPNAPVRGFMIFTDQRIVDLNKGLEKALSEGNPLIVPIPAHGRNYNFKVELHDTGGFNSYSKYTYSFRLLDAQGHLV